MKIRVSIVLLLVALLFTACTPAAPAVEPADMPAAPGNVSEPSTPEPATPPEEPAEPAPEAAPEPAAEPEPLIVSGVEIPPEYAEREVIILATLESETTRWGGTYNPNTIYARIRDFNDAQDEIYVALKCYMDPLGLNLPYERVYTQIATGDWSDLYYTGQQDFTSYILNNGGLIQDWKPVLEADPAFQWDDYITNIWDALEYSDGSLFDLCFSVSVRGGYVCGVGTKEDFGDRTDWTYDEALAYIKEKNYCITQDQLVRFGESNAYFNWIDLDTLTCDFEDQSFFEWLAYVKQFPTEKLSGAAEYTGWGLQGIKTHAQNYRNGGAWLRYRNSPGRYPRSVPTFVEDSLALSSTTEHLDACLTFVKWLLSYESQWKYHATAYANGFPLRRDVFEDALARAQLPGDDENSLFAGEVATKVMYDGTDYKIKIGDALPGIPAEEADYLRNLVYSLRPDRPAGFREDDIFLEEVQMCLAGDISDEECAERLQSRFTVLLAERK